LRQIIAKSEPLPSPAPPKERLGLELEHAFDYAVFVLSENRAAPDENLLATAETLRPLVGTGAVLPGNYFISGPRELPSWFLRAVSAGLARGGKILWLDAGNGFDAYGVSYFARAAGWDPKDILRRVELARPFNLYQLETMVTKKVPARWRGEPVVIADPMPLFYDEDVPVKEARDVLRRTAAGMERLAAAWIVLAPERKAPEGREGWTEIFARGARGRAVLGAEGELFRGAPRTLKDEDRDQRPWSESS
jgi:hypothetical protein